MDAVTTRPSPVSLVAACRALGVSRATVYRRSAAKAEPKTRESHRRLSVNERAAVLAVVNEPRFMDAAPAQIHAQLLREGTYLCSVRTMHRVLAGEKQQRERRDLVRHPACAVPRLVARGPNIVWSWDITKLLGPARWVYYFLYVVLDIFSRYVVAWMVSTRESAELATYLVRTAVRRHGIPKNQLTLHQDRGAPMTAKSFYQELVELDVTRSHSRPRVSNDNPYSESHFKTLKYRPGFPARFGSPQDARAHMRRFFPWYNTEHNHSALGYLTPAEVHFGHAAARLAQNARVLEQAWLAHPERFPHGKPAPTAPEIEVWINRPSENTVSDESPGPDEVVETRPRPSRRKLASSRAEHRAVAAAEPECGAASTPPPLHTQQTALGDGTNAPNPRGSGDRLPRLTLPMNHQPTSTRVVVH